MATGNHSRRAFLKGTAATSLLALVPYWRQAAGDVEQVTVGVIAVDNWQDYGYNQSHHKGAQAVAELKYARVLQQENVPAAAEVQRVMERMIRQGQASVIFATSWGYYDPHVLTVAKEFSDVKFFHCGGIWEEGHPPNVHTFFGRSDEPAFVEGIIAGHMSENGTLGFVASKPIADVIGAINAFTLGARYVNPDATVRLVFTGSWSDPVSEAHATNNLISQGRDVLACDVDSPKVFVQTCAKRKTFCCGRHVDQSSLAPNYYLTSAIWKWDDVYAEFVSKVHNEQSIPHNVRGGLKEGVVGVAPYGSAVPSDVREAADQAKQELTNGTLSIYKGPVRDNKGTVRVSEGETWALTDKRIEMIDWLVEGVEGSTE